MQLKHRHQEKRPWGMFEQFTLNEPATVKVITVDPGGMLSLQRHTNRDEFWRVVKGEGKVVVGEETLPAREGDEFFVPRGTLHRIIGTDATIKVLEIALGEFDEDDIERLDDTYGRG